MERKNGIVVKTQVAKFMQTLKWLGLRHFLWSFQSENYPFWEIQSVTTWSHYWWPMHLSLSWYSQLVKGDMLQYCNGLIRALDKKHTLVEQSFHSVLLGHKATNITFDKQVVLSTCKDIFKKILFFFLKFKQFLKIFFSKRFFTT